MEFSVVVPLFNKRASILRAVDSVLKQSHDRFELIVVDDGSTDDSVDMLENINDKRLRVVSQKNSGVSVARNHGVNLSKNDYVCFLDADDEWEVDFLQEIRDLVIQSPVSSLYCARYDIVQEDGSLLAGKLFTDKTYFGELLDFYDAYSESRSLICSSNCCVNKNLFLSMGGFPEGVSTGEDIYVWLRLGMIGKVSFSSKRLSRVYRNAENRTHTRVDVQIQYYFKYFLVENKMLIKDQRSKSLRRFLLRNAFVHSAGAVFHGSRKVAFKYAQMVFPLSFKDGVIITSLLFLPSYFVGLGKKIRNS